MKFDEIKNTSIFMCSCKTSGEKDCNQAWREMLNDLGCKSARHWFTSFYYAIDVRWGIFDPHDGWYYSVEISQPAVDQWQGFSVKVGRHKSFGNDPEKLASLYVECDSLEYGYAGVWRWLKELKKAMIEEGILKDDDEG